MELGLYFEDSETEESREKILPNPDAGALRQALEEMVEQPETVPVAVLVHSNEQDFIQFYVLDPDEEAAEPTAERLCQVEYCRRHWGGPHAQFFTEKLAFSEVLEIFKRYLDGDESWKKKGEWIKLVRAWPESGEDFRDKSGITGDGDCLFRRLHFCDFLVREDHVFPLRGALCLERLSLHWL